jgi:hypothetical protein
VQLANARLKRVRRYRHHNQAWRMKSMLVALRLK